MQQKKNSLLNKLVKKDYNNELEDILENKKIDENAKSTLLSILYKIETAYKDFETVKSSVETKEEFISKFLKIIEKDCDSIKILKMSDIENEIPKGKTYIINKDKKEIVAYPIERKILYAIAKIGKKDKIIKDKYYIINETLSELINVGNNIDMVETIRDFNGYSWTTMTEEIESIDHNLIYQNLRMLIGYEFLSKWISNEEYMIDYFDTFKGELETKYGKENERKIIDILSKISILLCLKYDKERLEKFDDEKYDILLEKEKINNREKFVEERTREKADIVSKIRYIDTVLNNKKQLEREYKERNETLPLENKIFSMRVLSKILEHEREEYLNEIKDVNKMLNPHNFVNYKKEIERKCEYFDILDTDEENLDEEIDKLKIDFQKVFLDVLEVKINKAQTRQEMEQIICDFRYYLLLPYSIEKNIQNLEEIQTKIKKVCKLIINKAIELKVIERVSDDKQTNYEVLKNIFNVRIINLEDAYLTITKEKEKYFVQIFDENVFEEKVEISKPKEIEIKPNKKISIITR